MTVPIAGLSQIKAVFDAVLIDQYGVLHDGRAAFDGALDSLMALRARGVPVVALTNSGRRAAANLARLARLGFPSDLFAGLISSGELARGRIEAMLSTGELNAGDRVMILSRDDDHGLVEGLPLAIASEGVALVLIAGARPETRSLDDYRLRLAPMAREGIPALCINPDRLMYVDGGTGFGPGAIAGAYRAMGGAVTMLGKPDPAMMAAGLSALGDPPPRRCLMIGDSPEHDIAGAARAGCRTLLVTDGVQGGLGGGIADYAIPRLRP